VPASFLLAWEPELVPELVPEQLRLRRSRRPPLELHIRSNPCHDDGTTSPSNRCKPALRTRKPEAAEDMAWVRVLEHKHKPEPERKHNRPYVPNNPAFPHSP
jgi:hypothetical protein